MKNLYGEEVIEEVEDDYTIEKKSSYFFFKSICNKDNVLDENPDLIKDYSPYVINRYFSFHYDSIGSSNEMNQWRFLDGKLQFDYFINTLRKRKRSLVWEVSSEGEDISLIKEYYNVSLSKAKDIYKLLSVDELGVIRKRLDKGGLRK
jgi:hypothetical protein